jgi:hypothetical protein
LATQNSLSEAWDSLLPIKDWTCLCESVRELVLWFVHLAQHDAEASASVAFIRNGIGRARPGDWCGTGRGDGRVAKTLGASDERRIQPCVCRRNCAAKSKHKWRGVAGRRVRAAISTKDIFSGGRGSRVASLEIEGGARSGVCRNLPRAAAWRGVFGGRNSGWMAESCWTYPQHVCACGTCFRAGATRGCWIFERVLGIQR